MSMLKWEDGRCVNMPPFWDAKVYRDSDAETWQFVAAHKPPPWRHTKDLFSASGFPSQDLAQRGFEFAMIGTGMLDLSPTTTPGSGWVVQIGDDKEETCGSCGITVHSGGGFRWQVRQLTVSPRGRQCEEVRWEGYCPTEAEAVREGMAIARALAQLEVAP